MRYSRGFLEDEASNDRREIENVDRAFGRYVFGNLGNLVPHRLSTDPKIHDLE